MVNDIRKQAREDAKNYVKSLKKYNQLKEWELREYMKTFIQTIRKEVLND